MDWPGLWSEYWDAGITVFNPQTAHDWDAQQAANAYARGNWIAGSLWNAASTIAGMSSYFDTAQTWYANQAAIADSQGNWGLGVTWDIVGGYAGGTKTAGQAWAGLLFGFLPGEVGKKIQTILAVSSIAQSFGKGELVWGATGIMAKKAEPFFATFNAAFKASRQAAHLADNAIAMYATGFADKARQIASRQAHNAFVSGTKALGLYLPDLGHNVYQAVTLSEQNLSHFLGPQAAHAVSPSPVGGVYLGGAGALIEGLGQISGIATDPETGALVLLTEEHGTIQLPPLRLDDVVTVFRSVYRHGEGPSVTINPRPDNPHGPWMDVVHGTATPDTYVGWVLFEADRIMKSYNLGADNDTKSPVNSKITGYQDVLDTIYFGGDFADGKKQGGNWERFWIVPAEVNHFLSSSKELTLFDVPLKVKTQRMLLKNGKLEDDPKGKPSKGALAFIDWFTRNYDGIAGEQYLQPPPETGIQTRVPIFAELQRIALMTALAERLRDQGVPMPNWMADYEVRRIPVASSTPATTVTKTKTTGTRIATANIYGGVNLSPTDDVIKEFAPGSDLKRLSPAQREVCVRQVMAADDLAPAVINAVRAKPMLVPVSVQRGQRQVKALALPGTESRALAPCRLEETDLEASIPGGGRVALVRHFNSFFQPSDAWGKGWTADWPHLEQVKLLLERTEKGVRFKLVHELSTPLNRIHARFSETRYVPELNANLLVPDQPCELLALAAADDPVVKQGKTKLVFRDGRNWFFDGKGALVGEQARPSTTVYFRDAAGRVQQMVGFDGDQPREAIRLTYDAGSRLASAESAQSGEKIAYEYNQDGALQSVTSSKGRTIYDYEDGFVKSISWSARIGAEQFEAPLLRWRFEYAPNGQLLAEHGPDGSKSSYGVEMQDGRYRLAITPADGSHGTEAEYDARLRPVEITHADRTRTQWSYEADGGVAVQTTFPQGEAIKTRISSDGKHRVTETSEEVRVGEDLDEGGRLTKLSLNQRPILQQEWHASGLLKSAISETGRMIPQYDEHGRLTSALRVKPIEEDRFSVWQETQFDPAGRVKAVKDHTGSNLEVSYDDDGHVAAAIAKRDGKDLGIIVKRNPAGDIEHVKSSWGEEDRRYDAKGELEEVVIKKGMATARAEYRQGCIASLTELDGSRLQFEYDTDDQGEKRLRSVQTPALLLKYHYRDDGTINGVDLSETCRMSYEHDAQGNLTRLTLEPAAGRI